MAKRASFLDVITDPVALTLAMCQIESFSGNEAEIADAVDATLRELPGLRVLRDGNAVVARTELGLERRMVIASHLDTVDGDVAAVTQTAERIIGIGGTDMKSGAAAALNLLATEKEPQYDITAIFYDNEEIGINNGIARILDNNPEWIHDGDLAVVPEPTTNVLQPGCLANINIHLDFQRTAQRTAVEQLLESAAQVAQYTPRQLTVHGCGYREGFSVVMVGKEFDSKAEPTGWGDADRAVGLINYRAAPDIQSAEDVAVIAAEALGNIPYRIHSFEPSGQPGLESPILKEFISNVVGVDFTAAESLEALAATVAKAPASRRRTFIDVADGPYFTALSGSQKPIVTGFHGWTDVSRLSSLMPAINFGPGNDTLHSANEYVDKSKIREFCAVMRKCLRTPPRPATRIRAAAADFSHHPSITPRPRPL